MTGANKLTIGGFLRTIAQPRQRPLKLQLVSIAVVLLSLAFPVVCPRQDSTLVVSLSHNLYFVAIVVASWAFSGITGISVAIVSAILWSFFLPGRSAQAYWTALGVSLPIMVFVAVSTSYLAARQHQVEKLNQHLERSTFDIIRALSAALEATDPYTSGHSERVKRFAIAIGERVGLPDWRVRKLEYAALLHDIGKLGIERKILLNPGKLDPDEFNTIKRHPEVGAEIISEVEFLKEAIPTIKHHHERMDGTGYPDGLKGEEIPLGARILAIADSFDAMTSNRPYRPAMSIPEAMKQLQQGCGTQFDPNLTEVFISLLREWGFETPSPGACKSHAHDQKTGLRPAADHLSA